MKKPLIYFVIFILLIQLTACRTLRVIDNEAATANFYPTEDIEVYTFNNDKYLFKEGDYSIVNDTLIDHGKKFKELKSFDYEGRIALADIDKIKTSQFDPAATIIIGGLAVAVIVVSISSIKLFDGSPLGEGKF